MDHIHQWEYGCLYDDKQGFGLPYCSICGFYYGDLPIEHVISEEKTKALSKALEEYNSEDLYE